MEDPEDLRRRIEAARATQAPPEARKTATGTASNAAAALGHSVGLVVAICLGAWIGLSIDTALGTAPFALLIFLVFGAAAGLLNIVRAGQKMAERAAGDQDEQDADKAP